MDHGHPDARFYPLGVLKDEASLVTTRIAGEEATRAVLIQLAVSGVLSTEASKHFAKVIDKLQKG